MRRDATKKEEKGSKYLLLFFRVSYRGIYDSIYDTTNYRSLYFYRIF